jgi:hypothetical protein
MRRGANFFALKWCIEKLPIDVVRRKIADNILLN